MEKQPASDQFLAYQLQQSITKPCILLWAMPRVGLPLPSQHFPLPTTITFQVGDSRIYVEVAKKKWYFHAQGRWVPSSAPMTSGSWGSMSEARQLGAMARGWVSSAKILTCFCQPSPQSHLTYSSCRDFGGPGGYCCHYFLKTVDPTAAWAQPCSSAQCRQGAGANSVPIRLDRCCVQAVSWLKVLIV